MNRILLAANALLLISTSSTASSTPLSAAEMAVNMHSGHESGIVVPKMPVGGWADYGDWKAVTDPDFYL